MRKTLLCLLLAPLFSMAQKGMQFEHAANWNTVLAKAKAENKFIFVDAFTTWCGPCKMMSATVFPQAEVGAYFNEHFINLAVQLDTTDKDDASVKAWYADAHTIGKQYKVNVYPTYLFFSPDGKLVHRAIGSSDAAKFIAKGKDALNPETQYYTLLDRYKAGLKDPAFLLKTATAARDAYDMENAGVIGKEYLATQKDMFTKVNLDFITQFTNSSSDPGFKLIMDNQARFDAIQGAGEANRKLLDIISREELYPVFRKKSPPDWNLLSQTVRSKYPKQADEAMAAFKVEYYQSKEDWNNFAASVVQYMNKYGAAASEQQLNSFAWTVFENCKDMKCVADALSWSKRSFAKEENPMYMDTYANILYKLGRKEEAITWEQKALALVPASEKKTYQETLDKMKKGEKTWSHM